MTDRRRSATVIRAAVFVAALGLALGARSATVGGQAAEVFAVLGVAVDVTAENAAQAREQALGEGTASAFRRLLERMTLRAHHGQLPKPGGNQIDTYVNDFSVAAEKTSAVRYLARLDFRFKAVDVRQLLIDYGLPFAETPSKPVLVLPVYQAAGALLLWDEPNPWREAWAQRPRTDSLVALVLPQGDLSDIAAIGAEQAVGGDVQRLSAVSARYNSGDTLVAHAILRMGAGGRPDLEVSTARYGAPIQEQRVVPTFSGEFGENLDDLLKRAAVELTLSIEDNWKQSNLLQFGHSAVVAVTVPIGGLEDWLAVRRRLQGVAVLRNTELVLLSRDEVRINLHYIGELEQLALALEQTDLGLARQGDDWILKLSGGGGNGR